MITVNPFHFIGYLVSLQQETNKDGGEHIVFVHPHLTSPLKRGRDYKGDSSYVSAIHTKEDTVKRCLGLSRSLKITRVYHFNYL